MMSRRSWSDADLEFLAACYHTTPVGEIARRLERTVRACYEKASVRGLCRTRASIDENRIARIVELNAAGATDVEIAAELDMDRHGVSARREAMGLPCRQYGERARAATRARTAAQCAAAGVASLGELRALAHKVRAVKAGWPVDLRWQGVRILDLLDSRGPMTRKQIAEALGMPWRGSRQSLASNDPEGSYLAHLIRRGLVISLGRIVRGDGRGKSVAMYALAIGARRKPIEELELELELEGEA